MAKKPESQAEAQPKPPEPTAIETALSSARRSRNKAKAEGDRGVASIMLRAESQLLNLLADREGQMDLADKTEPASG